MERDVRRRQAEALDRYWDAVVSGDEQGASPDVDETRAEIIRQLQSLGATPGMEEARGRIWEHVTHRSRRDLEDLVMDATGIVSSIGPALRKNGRVDLLPVPGGSPGLRGAANRRRWMMTQFTTAALLVLTLVAGLVAFGPWRRGFSNPPQGRQLAAIIAATPEAGQFEFLWRSTGGPDSIKSAYGLGIDPEGNIWVAEGGTDRFQIIAPAGTYRETWGTPGSGDGQFEFLSTASAYGRAYGDVAFAEGNIYVADTGNFRVQKFAPDRTFLRAWGSKGKSESQFLAPSSIAIGGDGVVYVSDEARADVQMFNSDGQYLGVIGKQGREDGQFSVPAGVTIDGNGDVWVADWGRLQIQHFTSSGDWLDTWGESGSGDDGALRNPNDVAVDDMGRVYVVVDFSSALHAFDTVGRFLATTGGIGTDRGEFSDPLGIAVENDGTVYVSDQNGVQAFRLLPP